MPPASKAIQLGLKAFKFSAKSVFKGAKFTTLLPFKSIGFAMKHPILAYTGYKAASGAAKTAKDVAKPVVKGCLLFELFKFFFDFLSKSMSPEEFAEIVGPIRESLHQLIEPMAGPMTSAIMKPIDDMLQYDKLNGASEEETAQLAKLTSETVTKKLESANAEAVAREAEQAGYDEFGSEAVSETAEVERFNQEAQALLDATHAYVEESRINEATQNEAEITAGRRTRSGRLTTFLSAVRASEAGEALPASGLSCLTNAAEQSAETAPSASMADRVFDSSREENLKSSLSSDGLAASVSDTRSSFSVGGGIGGA